MNWNSWKMFGLRAAITLANTGLAGWTGIQVDRNSSPAAGIDVGPLQWAQVACLVGMVAGIGIINGSLRAIAKSHAANTAGDVAPHMAALGKEASALIGKGNLDGAAAFLEAARKLSGKGG